MHPSLRHLASTLLFCGGLLAGHAGSLHAQEVPAREAHAAPQPWRTLSAPQRALLAPMRDDWDTLPPRKQAHMLEKTEHWLTLPPEQQDKIRDRIARWHAMTPEQRHLARENMRKFHELPPEQREQLHHAYQQFQRMPPAQREKLLRKWRSQTIEQRQQWLREMGPAHHPRADGARPPGPGSR
ncbi:MAG: DUF3106 domain-containing protein [Dyella sp.]|uniref:DUF3106 domain-containing protein n=1 Tax=Dyella sp. TaxID=1869338 RepID=UPI003F7D8436